MSIFETPKVSQSRDESEDTAEFRESAVDGAGTAYCKWKVQVRRRGIGNEGKMR
jgi:hypothetical protein